ncbi:hypothetical protein [Pseudomonas sp.]|uniref:hypothetical protein n=1 Tax=Pseudomonas sp. TaxID=306 RepID=UPI003D6DF0CA
MTANVHFWHPGIQFAFLLCPFVIGLSGVAINYYVACSRHFQIMFAALPNSAWPQEQLYKGGVILLISRLNMIAGISGFMLFPQYSVRKGLVDADDVHNFPRLPSALVGYFLVARNNWRSLAALGAGLDQAVPKSLKRGRRIVVRAPVNRERARLESAIKKAAALQWPSKT